MLLCITLDCGTCNRHNEEFRRAEDLPDRFYAGCRECRQKLNIVKPTFSGINLTVMQETPLLTVSVDVI